MILAVYEVKLRSARGKGDRGIRVVSDPSGYLRVKGELYSTG